PECLGRTSVPRRQPRLICVGRLSAALWYRSWYRYSSQLHAFRQSWSFLKHRRRMQTMSKRSTSAFLLLAAALLLVPPGAYAQTTGRILGQVLDAQGAALPGATITVTSPNLQGAQTQVTDSEGNYRFLSLPPGRYTVKVELASFKTYEQANVDVG